MSTKELILERRHRTTVKELQRQWGSVADKAIQEPVVITSNGRDRHVLMGVDEYVKLILETRKSYLVRDLPDPLLGMLEDGLAELRVSEAIPDERHQIK